MISSALHDPTSGRGGPSMTSPYDVVRETLLQPVLCPKCVHRPICLCLPNRSGRLDAQATMVVEALRAAGMLPDPQAEPTADDYDRLAQQLAEDSQHPRYGDDGWRKLLESDADVKVAHAAAVKALGTSSQGEVARLGQVRDALLAEGRKRRAATVTGP